MEIAIISALIGAVFGGLVTGIATWWTFTKNQDALITGVTHGIYTEINTLWSIYKIKFKDAFPILEYKELRKNNYLTKKYPLYLYPHYFVVYDSNCRHIGQIPNNELRKEIVTGYLRAREMLDAYLHNNALLKALDNLKSQQRQTTSNIYDKDVEALENELKEHVQYIAKVHSKVKEFHIKVNKLMDAPHGNKAI